MDDRAVNGIWSAAVAPSGKTIATCCGSVEQVWTGVWAWCVFVWLSAQVSASWWTNWMKHLAALKASTETMSSSLRRLPSSAALAFRTPRCTKQWSEPWPSRKSLWRSADIKASNAAPTTPHLCALRLSHHPAGVDSLSLNHSRLHGGYGLSADLYGAHRWPAGDIKVCKTRWTKMFMQTFFYGHAVSNRW